MIKETLHIILFIAVFVFVAVPLTIVLWIIIFIGRAIMFVWAGWKFICLLGKFR